MKKLISLLLLLGPGLALARAAAPQANDIRIQQFDGLNWQWVSITPTNGGALAFDGSLQFLVNAGAGETNVLSSLGASNATVKPLSVSKSGVTLRLLSLEQGSNCVLSLTSTTLVMNASAAASPTKLTLVGTTNQVIFGATNIAPSSAVAPTKWISVQVTGDSGVYRLPLYE